MVTTCTTGSARPGSTRFPAWLDTIRHGAVITDSVGFAQALAEGRLDRRPMFAALDGDRVVWADGAREPVDAIILATGYRPSLGYLRELGALDAGGAPMHVGGISITHPGLVYVGLEYQRSYASNTLRGVSDDADAVVEPLAAWVATRRPWSASREVSEVDAALELSPKSKRLPGEPTSAPVAFPDVDRDRAASIAEVAKALGDPVRVQ